MAISTPTRPVPTVVEPNRRRRTRPNLPAGIFGFIWLIIAIVPVYYVVITSLKTQANFFDGNPLLPPSNPTLDSYKLVLQNDFLGYFLNSVIVTVVTWSSRWSPR